MVTDSHGSPARFSRSQMLHSLRTFTCSTVWLSLPRQLQCHLAFQLQTDPLLSRLRSAGARWPTLYVAERIVMEMLTDGKVLLPYIKTKMDRHHEGVAERVQGMPDSALEPGWSFRVYPYFNLAYEGSLLVYQILYMHDYTRYYDWFLHLQGIEVKRMGLPELVGSFCSRPLATSNSSPS